MKKKGECQEEVGGGKGEQENWEKQVEKEKEANKANEM